MNRRLFLRNAATTLWLPFLPSALPRSAWGETPSTPRRMVFWYVPNGLYWRAITPGETYAEAVLNPLVPVWDRVTTIGNLKNETTQRYSSHEGATASLLTDYVVDASRPIASISADQVAADSIGHETPIASLQLGLPDPGLLNSGARGVLTHNISWTGDRRALPKVLDPRRLFQRIFGAADPAKAGDPTAVRQSVLDAVLERANAMNGRLATDDRHKLDQYMSSVREVERQLEAIEDFTCDRPDEPRPNLPFELQYRAMADLVVLALQCDYTRVVTFMAGPSTAYHVYGHLGHSQDHHTLSHASNAQEFMEIHEWHVEEMATTLQAMEAISEGPSDLLANTTFTLLSEFGEPDRHGAHNLAWIHAGGEAGGIVNGRPVDANFAPHSNYLRTLINFMGVQERGFGTTSTGRLDLT